MAQATLKLKTSFCHSFPNKGILDLCYQDLVHLLCFLKVSHCVTQVDLKLDCLASDSQGLELEVRVI